MLLILYLISLLSLVNSEIISPIFGLESYKNQVLNEIYSSQISIMATIYKFDDDDIFNAFVNVGNQGVEMKLICDKSAYEQCSKLSNYGLIKQFNMRNYKNLHAKTLLIDGRTLIIGSFNLDNYGFSTNMEIGLITQNTTTITEYIYFMDSLMNQY